ncbi:MAG TPA: glycosyltransferase 87 family protein, partial [Chloroflexota bacterium]|nr:glycosyltransferase 87 family protein [Chloroflexota bacterium]
WRWWRVRSLPFRSPEVLRAFSLTCVCTLVLVPDVSFYHRALLLAPLVTLAVQPRAGTALARSCHRLALLGAAAPVALLAFAALLLARGPETEFVVAILSASEASLIALPLVLLPAFLVPTTPVSFVAPRRTLRAAGRGAAALAAAAAGVAYVQVSGDAALSHLRAAYLESGRTFFSSDLFQPWYAGRAMLAGVNPYSPAFASQLHQIVYGRPFAPGPAGHAEMQFFYPPFVALSVAPFLPLPFDAARFLAAALLALAVGAAAWLWARTSGFTRRASVVAVVLGLLFFPTQEIVWIQQLSGLAVFFVIAAFAAASRRRYALSGALVALAFVKPQLSLIPAAPLLLWSLAHRRRWPLWISCAVATAAQLVLAELLVPGWIAPFLTTTRSYGAVNQADWLPGLLTGSAGAGAALCLVIAAVTAAAWWRCRHVDAADPRWLHAAALTFAARSLVVPDVSYYNRALLIAPLITALSLLPRAGATRRVATHLALVVSSLHLPLLAFVGVARWSGLADLLSPALTSGAQVSLFLLPVFVFTCLTPFRLPVLRLARSASPSPVGVAA